MVQLPTAVQMESCARSAAWTCVATSVVHYSLEVGRDWSSFEKLFNEFACIDFSIEPRFTTAAFDQVVTNRPPFVRTGNRRTDGRTVGAIIVVLIVLYLYHFGKEWTSFCGLTTVVLLCVCLPTHFSVVAGNAWWLVLWIRGFVLSTSILYSCCCYFSSLFSCSLAIVLLL